MGQPVAYRCDWCGWVFAGTRLWHLNWHWETQRNRPGGPVCPRTYSEIYVKPLRASGSGALSLLVPSVVAGGGAGAAAAAGPAEPATSYASFLAGSLQAAPASSGEAAQHDAWDGCQDMDMEGMDMEAGKPDHPDPPTANGLANWPTEQRLQAIEFYRPKFRLKDGGGASEEIPLSDLSDENRSQRQAYVQHARRACRGPESLAMQAYPLEPAARAKLGPNWADEYDQQVRSSVDSLHHRKTPSFLMAANFMANWLPSQAGQDAFLRLMSAKAFNCKDVQCQSFAEMQRAILKSMPDMLRSKEWHVTILGKGGQPVEFFFADKSPVTLWYHNAWEVGLRMYADPGNKGKSTLRPTPTFTEGDMERIFRSFADGQYCETSRPPQPSPPATHPMLEMHVLPPLGASPLPVS